MTPIVKRWVCKLWTGLPSLKSALNRHCFLWQAGGVIPLVADRWDCAQAYGKMIYPSAKTLLLLLLLSYSFISLFLSLFSFPSHSPPACAFSSGRFVFDGLHVKTEEAVLLSTILWNSFFFILFFLNLGVIQKQKQSRKNKWSIAS